MNGWIETRKKRKIEERKMVKIKLDDDRTVEGPDIKEMFLKDWLSEAEKLFGSDPRKWKFKCPNCGHIQSIEDFLELKKRNIIKPDVDVGTFVYYSCIGRFDTRILSEEVGTIFNKKSPCNYTNGGLFCFANVFVIREDGTRTPVFDFDRDVA